MNANDESANVAEVPELPAYARNPNLYIRRPAEVESNAGSGRQNALADQVRARAKEGRSRMKKLLAWGVVLIVAYALLGIAAGRLLSAKIEEAERKLPGIGVAISRIATDQLRASERMRDITSKTLEQGGSKVDEVAMMLGDAELNRLALAYLGADGRHVASGDGGGARRIAI